MKIKRGFGKFAVFMVLTILTLSLSACSSNRKDNADVDLSLDKLKTDTEYQYGEIEWGLSIDDVINKLPYSIEIDEGKVPVPENYAFYKSQNHFILDEQKSTASFEFQGGKLNIVKFDFTLDENYQQWFDSQVEKLIQLYGTERDKTQTENEKFISTVYKWEADTTTLQLILMTGDPIKPAATIGVTVKP